MTKNNVGMRGGVQPVVLVGDKQFSCDLTMGGLLRFNSETKKELKDVDFTDILTVTTLMWCCVCAASNRDKSKFNMSLGDFADCVSPQDIKDWAELIFSNMPGGEEEEKKA